MAEKKNPNAKDMSQDDLRGQTVIGRWDFKKGGIVPLTEKDHERLYGKAKPEKAQ